MRKCLGVFGANELPDPQFASNNLRVLLIDINDIKVWYDF